MAANDITCNVCDGTDFFIEAGHYYCTECRTQSQDIIEQVFDVPEETTAARPTSSKRIRKKKKIEDQLTSWECYNYILLGLVNELIELGADSKLKRVVHILWFKYLKKLEVISDKPGETPKLSAINSRKNAEILYGRVRKKRRSSRSPSPASTTDTSITDASILRREKAKQRRSMIVAQYDELSNTMQSEDVSLHNQSLISLRSGSDSSKTKEEKYLRYNEGSKKELLKIMTKHHLKAHCRDVDSLLDCHKVSYKTLTHKFAHGYEVLSRSKIYALLYLGLLINKDKIQLADLLRFIREGNLSFHSVRHFFPEEYEGRIASIKSWNSANTLLCHFRLREIAADIAKHLKITKYIPRQNLAELCRRYCTELNLPDEVWGYTLNLMSKALPKMHVTEQSSIMPNYEGRTMCFIMFFLKLILGLDEVTEDRFSSYAENINNSNIVENKMFIWKDWIHYINYRKLVLMQHHFPTKYLYDYKNVGNQNISIDFLNEQNSKHEIDQNLTREAEVLKQLLERLKDNQPLPRQALQFMPTFTPFRDYTKTLLASTIPQENNYLLDVLSLDFNDYSFNFLINPIFYLEQLSKDGKVGVKHRGANNNLKIVRIPNPKVDRESWRRVVKRSVHVKISKKAICNNNKKDSMSHLRKSDVFLKNIKEINSKKLIKNFEQRNMKLYTKNLKRLLANHRNEREYSQAQLENSQEEIATQESENLEEPTTSRTSQKATGFSQEYSFVAGSQNSQSAREHLNGANTKLSQDTNQSSQSIEENMSHIHYNPFDRYCLMNVSNISKEEFREFITRMPNSFRLLLNECSRITEQDPWELFNEFQNVEIYLCYVAQFTKGITNRYNIVNNDLKRFISRAKKIW
ncbi:hypothetical protein ILUMI_08574 [Ignelater luminosus]|uniref:Rrn7/TAF1B C-terminal cyclin domain-containing protein n=1 Tax=Ignelater luminosus TaxID=2038154 RepID=A0A8K0D1E6_IGNLU|nr:hypothetical protein ILUMI_08574 [Ignelater luminosus]